MDIKKEINKVFTESNLSFEEPYISAKYHLRFELGDTLKNGTKKRVRQAQNRAKKLFNYIYDPEDTLWLISFDQKAEENISFWGNTYPFLKDQINEKAILKQSTFTFNEDEFSTFFDEDTEQMKDITYHWKHTHSYSLLKLKEINVDNILLGIANLEMGFDPKIDTIPYFLNLDKKIGFYMYDDRGCLLFSNDKLMLKKMYDKFNHWLVDYHRETFDTWFKKA